LYGRLSDWVMFEIGGRVLIRYSGHYAIPGGPLHVYAQFPHLQIGPPALSLAAATQLLGPTGGRIFALVLMTAVGIGCVAVTEAVAATVGVRRATRQLGALVGGLAVLAAWSTVGAWAMHFDDVLAMGAVCGAAL